MLNCSLCVFSLELLNIVYCVSCFDGIKILCYLSVRVRLYCRLRTAIPI